ncbi:hypothetical protein [Serratia marcescens]|uniref:hypothetical protein n=1 Tax=Serratia marcescens TaxID=615 RepID=UPI003517742B
MRYRSNSQPIVEPPTGARKKLRKVLAGVEAHRQLLRAGYITGASLSIDGGFSA